MCWNTRVHSPETKQSQFFEQDCLKIGLLLKNEVKMKGAHSQKNPIAFENKTKE
jgi:hypothetical protein